MEVLQKLENMQATIHMLHSVGISDANPDCERFLAEFTLLLMQDCGGVDIMLKCQLVSKNLSQISRLVIPGALKCGADAGSQVEKIVHLDSDDNTNLDLVENFCVKVPMVGIDAIMRSNSTLEDFCRSYFMFHKMDANQPQSIFRYLPVISFTESFIYQLDALNEQLLKLPKGGVPIFSKDFHELSPSSKALMKFVKDPFRPLIIVLERHGLLTERILEELRCGEEYWALERKLCCALVSNKEISIEDVTRAIYLKSFDFRILNLLLYQLRGEEVNDLHMEFLSTSELLVEVSDDLFDYEDDILENSFNVLRMFVRCYGASAAAIMMAKFITEAEEKYNHLLKELDPELCMKYQRRCEEATREGGKVHGPSLGTWHVPPVIEDETAYRAVFTT